MTATAKIIVVESRSFLGRYELRAREAIIDHPTHGRLLIRQGYCGESQLRGGAYRWDGGAIYGLRQDDTFATLTEGAWNADINLYHAVVNGHDDSRPLLDWPGRAIESMAESAGL